MPLRPNGEAADDISAAQTAGLPALTVAIQAGGESRRMGRSKATVPFGGRPLLCRLVERVADVADEILITTNGRDDLSFLAKMPQAPKIRVVRDLLDVRGSMTGLYTALSLAENDFVAVCACDMMDVSGPLFAAELKRAVEGDYDVVVPEDSKGFEPFHGVYRRKSCLASALRRMHEAENAPQDSPASRRGGASMKSVVLDPELRLCSYSMEEVRLVANAGCFANCNTPEELARAEERIFGKADLAK